MRTARIRRSNPFLFLLESFSAEIFRCKTALVNEEAEESGFATDSSDTLTIIVKFLLLGLLNLTTSLL